MPTTTANLALTLPTPNVDTGWGSTLNTDFTLIDNLFAAGGTGTSVGLNVGSGKTLGISGTLLLGGGDGTGTTTAPTIRGAARTGTNVVGANLTIDAANGTGTGGSGSLIFRTAPAGAAGTLANTFQNSLVIDSAGNVGIGTTPSYKLDVNGQANFQGVRVGANGDTIDGSGGLLAFQTSGAERMRINASGAVSFSGASAYGTTGQVLTSNGSGGSPSWQNTGVSQGTVQTFAASGNSFTGIPSTVKTIVINIAGWDPSADAYIRIGTSSGFDTTSYVSSGSLLSASGTSTLSDTLGFIVNANPSVLGHGSIRLTNLNGNYWVCEYTIGSSGNLVMVGGGGLGLGGVLDRVQIVPKSGTFAASGVVNINYF